jgi:hypothetical protein
VSTYRSSISKLIAYIWAAPNTALGHVILGTCHKEIAALREHEYVHVRQYEQWGVFFLPAYALSSAWEVAHGRCGYRSNFFERQAYAVEGHPKFGGR